MKTILLISSLLIAQITNASFLDKDSLKQKSKVGVFIGQSVSTVGGSEIDRMTVPSYSFPDKKVVDRKSVYISIHFKKTLNDVFYLKYGLGYLEKGGYIEGSSSYYEPIFHINYINIPIIVGLSTPLKSSTRASIEFGIAGNLKVGGDTSWWTSNGFTGTIKQPFDGSLGLNFEADVSERLTLSLNYRLIRDLSPLSDRDFQNYNYTIYSTTKILSVGLLIQPY